MHGSEGRRIRQTMAQYPLPIGGLIATQCTLLYVYTPQDANTCTGTRAASHCTHGQYHHQWPTAVTTLKAACCCMYIQHAVSFWWRYTVTIALLVTRFAQRPFEILSRHYVSILMLLNLSWSIAVCRHTQMYANFNDQQALRAQKSN